MLAILGYFVFAQASYLDMHCKMARMSWRQRWSKSILWLNKAAENNYQKVVEFLMRNQAVLPMELLREQASHLNCQLIFHHLRLQEHREPDPALLC